MGAGRAHQGSHAPRGVPSGPYELSLYSEGNRAPKLRTRPLEPDRGGKAGKRASQPRACTLAAFGNYPPERPILPRITAGPCIFLPASARTLNLEPVQSPSVVAPTRTAGYPSASQRAHGREAEGGKACGGRPGRPAGAPTAQTGCALTWSPRPSWQHPHRQSPFRPDPSATLCFACARRGAGSYHPQALRPSLKCHSTFSTPLRCRCSFVHAGAWVETPVSAGTKGGGSILPHLGMIPPSRHHPSLRPLPPRCLPGAATAQPTGNKCSGHRGRGLRTCSRARCLPARLEPEGPRSCGQTDGQTDRRTLVLSALPGW